METDGEEEGRLAVGRGGAARYGGLGRTDTGRGWNAQGTHAHIRGDMGV
jgi:hypothetical protein